MKRSCSDARVIVHNYDDEPGMLLNLGKIMPLHQRRYPKEELARRGREIYERDVKPRLEKADEGKFVLIDIESGDWEMDSDEMGAPDRLYARRPDGQMWME